MKVGFAITKNPTHFYCKIALAGTVEAAWSDPYILKTVKPIFLSLFHIQF